MAGKADQPLSGQSMAEEGLPADFGMNQSDL